MVYKLGHVADMASLPSLNTILADNIYEFLSVLDNEYGAERDVVNDDGGYILFATVGTSPMEMQEYYNLENSCPEWVNRIKSIPPYCAALYLSNNEYSVVVIMAVADAPASITSEFEEDY